MRILLCIDDTDNLDSIGTGEIASMIANEIKKRGWGECSKITRHQLFIHEDIPYTSHNSSMCFTADISQTYLHKIIHFASGFLANESAEGSDPALCVVVIDALLEPERLINFGKKAKTEIVSKKEAYDLAELLKVHLSEHGGTGLGIIGALAGAGLRLCGNDGRFKGKIDLDCNGSVMSVRDIISMAKIDVVKDIEGDILDENELVKIEESLKTVLLDGKAALLVCQKQAQEPVDYKWITCTKKQLKQF